LRVPLERARRTIGASTAAVNINLLLVLVLPVFVHYVFAHPSTSKLVEFLISLICHFFLLESETQLTTNTNCISWQVGIVLCVWPLVIIVVIIHNCPKKFLSNYWSIIKN